MSKYNIQRRNAFVWLIISASGLLMTAGPFVFGADMMGGWGALVFTGVALFISGILVSVIFFKRSAALNRMFSGRGLLAHWVYDEPTWREHAEKEYSFRKGANIFMFFLISGMCLFMGIIFFIIDPEGGKYVLFVMAAVIVLIGIAAFLTAWAPYRRSKRKVSEAFISTDGVFINNQLHTWGTLGSRLESVRIVQDNSLEFTYSYLSRAGRQEYVFHVPIPSSEMKRAVYIAGFFQNSI